MGCMVIRDPSLKLHRFLPESISLTRHHSLRTQAYFRLSFLSKKKRQPEIRLRSQAKGITTYL